MFNSSAFDILLIVNNVIIMSIIVTFFINYPPVFIFPLIIINKELERLKISSYSNI